MPLPRYIRGRRPRILLFIACGAVLFFLMQFFALKVLNMSAKKNARMAVVSGIVMESEHNKPVEFDQTIDEKKEESLLRDKLLVLKNLSLPRGVHSEKAKLYHPDKDNMFHCIKSQKRIHFSRVNDDYCDCEDSSDEPGTSACPDALFYCHWQMPDTEPHLIVSSRVNDGLCDCCDGSDEWNNVLLPKDLVIKVKNKKSSVYQGPCENKCAKIIQMNQENYKIKQLGKRLKKSYLQAAGVLDNKAYTVCPFESVKQQQFPHPARVLGRRPQWKHVLPYKYVLQMIHFICGLNDKVTQILEDDRCLYIVKFSTPAAC
ncbi:hypothetical protein KUTeg_000048 [Tegillarca granosa]|uniref:Glucosidase II beta subunit N-terminal domain-containing protein n=1 Tax=Tegillarca granosa TaxID=220873 RepID=A0ABQ9FYT2_TEGGR|nr:hypothetical protein KUTeg_000048 [Tegillarca granosa]